MANTTMDENTASNNYEHDGDMIGLDISGYAGLDFFLMYRSLSFDEWKVKSNSTNRTLPSSQFSKFEVNQAVVGITIHL